MASSTEVEFSTRFEKDFSLMTSFSSSMSQGVWYIDSGASRHMTRVKEFFTSLIEKDLDLERKLDDDTRYKEVGLGTIFF